VVTTTVQGFSVAKTRVSSLAFWRYGVVGRQLRTFLDNGFELC